MLSRSLYAKINMNHCETFAIIHLFFGRLNWSQVFGDWGQTPLSRSTSCWWFNEFAGKRHRVPTICVWLSNRKISRTSISTHSSVCIPFKCAKGAHSQLKMLPWVNECSLTHPLCGRLLVRDFRAIFFFVLYLYCYWVFLQHHVRWAAIAKSYCKKQKQRRTTTHTMALDILLFEFFFQVCMYWD